MCSSNYRRKLRRRPEAGTDSGGYGPVVVLLHANTGTSETWKPQIGPLSAGGYRVIAFDRRGWGKSLATATTEPQPGTIAGDMDMLVDYLHVPRFHLVGAITAETPSVAAGA